ncbi:Hsp20/alpha crystallin family protein [Siminovitchia sp. FSL H7-0308]|jgi:hypothetical protein|uniref:Uncharacterized protein n=1 Tax=Siminovitchia thermophila TaxID=1245522 RepID=A0ABS2R6W5_9BACI|nr:Hsp20/alpha crystallin family protein [Siminovitchia thermophila]MBM7714628.1 hypothetical protein [Siminovitchia thermophila]ONK22677.1 hypothetical protein BLX87_14985 [Bacillus sp. VT-16-64]
MLPFPFLSKGGLPKWLTQSYLNNDIQKFVQEMVEQSISSSIKNAKMMGSVHEVEEERPEQANGTLQASTFESNDHVYVRVFVKDESVLPNVKIYHSSNELVIEGMPSSDDRHIISLPSPVRMKESVSEYRDHHLQIKMKKRIDPQFTEVAVPTLD